jgi:hypothetical protein
MLHKRVAMSVVLLTGSIVGPQYTAVNGGLSASRSVSKERTVGSPMPVPKPAEDVLVADGSPMPIPKPTAI